MVRTHLLRAMEASRVETITSLDPRVVPMYSQSSSYSHNLLDGTESRVIIIHVILGIGLERMVGKVAAGGTVMGWICILGRYLHRKHKMDLNQ